MKEEAYELTYLHERGHWWFRSRRDLLLAQLSLSASELKDPSRPLRILDFGCGTGFNLKEFSRFGEVMGADRAAKSLASYGRFENFSLIDLEGDTREFRGRFDLVTALDVLEHFEDEQEGLAEILGFLRPSGQLILTVPAFGWLWGDEDELSNHFRRYTRSSLTSAARTAGTRIRFMSYFNASILPFQALSIWLRKPFRTRNSELHSNLGTLPRPLNELLYLATRTENLMVGRQRLVLPAGSSLLCRLEKPGGLRASS